MAATENRSEALLRDAMARLRDADGRSERRPNPSVPIILERRAGDGGRWVPATEVFGDDGLADEISSPSFRLDYGDLVRAMGPQSQPLGLWVNARSGLASAGTPLPFGMDWLEDWEGEEANGVQMMRDAIAVDRRRQTLAACACAAEALNLSGLRSQEYRDALELAVKWATPAPRTSKAADQILLNRIRSQLDAAGADPTIGRADRFVVEAVTCAAMSPFVELRPGNEVIARSTPAPMAAAAVESAAITVARDGRTYPSSYEDLTTSSRKLAKIVARWIPLAIVLLANAGDPTPPDLAL